MRDLRISELIQTTALQQQSLIPIVDGGSTKKTELSTVWLACLNGTLNSNNNATFTQNVYISGDLTALHGNFIDFLKIPSGTTSDRISTLGAIRYNTTIDGFEGFNGIVWGQLGDNVLHDKDNDTRIEVKASSTFSDTDQIKFTTNGSLRTIILSSGEVGIGTSVPTKHLTVVGDISATGRVYGANFYPQRRFEYIPSVPSFSVPISYSGTAPFGSAESDALWTITRIIYNASGGSVTSIDTRTNAAWSDRMFVFTP